MEIKPANAPARDDLATVAAAFAIPGDFLEFGRHGNGHINDTFRVAFAQGGSRVRYILQRINHRIFRDVPSLMANIQRVTVHASAAARRRGDPDGARRSLTLVPTREGLAYWRDPTGSFWRCYPFIEKTETREVVKNPRDAFATAKAFGEFQRMLLDLPGPRLHETIPRFHDTRSRLEALKRSAGADLHRRAALVRPELDFVLAREPLVDGLLDLQRRGEMPERITHNDAKLNNVLLDSVSGEAICVTDLDTVMPGLALFDFGDMVRSAASSAVEDERDLAKVALQLPLYEQLVRGYADSAGSFLNPAERAHLAFSGKLITLEMGIRFLADYLDGDTYYKTARPGHNLDRSQNQFALVRSMEKQENEMRTLTDRVFRTPAKG